MKTIQLSKNLTLISIQENHWQNGKLLAVVCYFRFFDEEGVAYISTDKLTSKYASYGITEISSELAGSFNDIIEENWERISREAKKFVKEWNLENVQ